MGMEARKRELDRQLTVDRAIPPYFPLLGVIFNVLMMLVSL